MVLPKYKKIFLLFFLFVFVGNILFAPFAAKAEDPSTPTPQTSSNCGNITITYNHWGAVSDDSQRNIDQCIAPNDVKLSITPSSNKAKVSLSWNTPSAGQSWTANYSYDNTRENYQFNRYEIALRVFVDNQLSLSQTVANQTGTIYSANVDFPSSAKERITYEYTVTAFYKHTFTIMGHPIVGLIHEYSASSIATDFFQPNGNAISGNSAIDYNTPFLQAIKNIQYENNQVVVTFVWNPPQNTPDKNPKYKLYQKLEKNTIYTPEPVATTNDTSLQNQKVWGNVDANSEFNIVYTIKAEYSNNSNIGYSNTRTLHFGKDTNGKFFASDAGSGAAPNDKVVNQTASGAPADNDVGKLSCGCTNMNPIQGTVCDMLCSFTNMLAGVAYNAVHSFMFASIKDPNSTKPKGLIENFSADKNNTNRSEWVFTLWQFALNLVNAFLIAILIFLAFVNILHIQIDTYALKKILPMLVLGVIFANFSMFICRAIIDFSDMLTLTFTGNLADLTNKVMNALGMGLLSAAKSVSEVVAGLGWFGTLVSGLTKFVLSIASALLIILVFGFVTIGAFILGFLLWVRIPIISILVAISPLAFMAMTFPMTQKYFTMWWGQFLNWVFMLPVIMFLFKAVSLLNTENTQFSLAAYFVALLVMFIAIQVPFKMGGAVMASWSTFGKKLAGGAYKGYGSTWGALGKMKTRDAQGNVVEGGLKSRLGKFFTNTNLYGVEQFGKEKLEVMEKNRMKQSKKGALYPMLAGQEAAGRNAFAEDGENVRGMTTFKQLADYLNGVTNDGDIPLDSQTAEKWASMSPSKYDDEVAKWNKTHTGKERITGATIAGVAMTYRQAAGLQLRAGRAGRDLVGDAQRAAGQFIANPATLIGQNPMGKAGVANQIDPQKAAEAYGQSNVENFNPMQHAIQQDLERNLAENLTDPHLSAEIKPLVELHASPEYMIKNQNLFGETNDKIKKMLEPLAKNQLGKIELGEVSATVLEDVALKSKINIAKEINPYLENETAIKQAINSDRTKRQQNIQNMVNSLNLPDLKINGPVQNITLKDRMKINEKLDVEINKSNAGEELKAKLKEAKRQVNIDFNGMHYGDTAEKTFDKIKNDFGSIKNNIADKITGEK